MREKRPLTETEVHDRLVAARDALGEEPGDSDLGSSTLTTARRALSILQIGLVKAMEEDSDQNEAIIPDDQAS